MSIQRVATGATALMLLTAIGCGGDDGATTDSTSLANTSTAAAPAPSGGPLPPSGTSGGQTAAPDGCTATVPGTQIDFAVFSGITEIDPTQSPGSIIGGHELAAVYDVLLRFDHETNMFVPHLAESLRPNDDYTVWTLKLRDGIKYADGTPLTAQLVDDNMDRFFDGSTTNLSAGFMTSITRKRVIDPLTLEVTLDAPWFEFPFVFADEPGMIVNLNAIGDDFDAFTAKPPPAAGLGPYVVQRNAPNEELVMTARDDYWGGPVCVETLRFATVPGGPATYDAFTNDEFDVAYLRDPSVVKRATEAGEEGFFAHQDFGSTIFINHAEGRPGNDVRVRQAMSLALDADIINERAHDNALQADKALVTEGSRFWSDAIIEPETNIDAASQLVAEAKADGFDGKVQLLCNTTPPSPDVGITVEGLLTAAGFDVSTEILPIADAIARQNEEDFDATCTGSVIGPATGPSSVVRTFHSQSDANRLNYASDEMDAALAAFLAADTPETQQATMAAINEIYVDDTVSVSYGATEEGVIWSPEVHGIVPTSAVIMLFHDAYLEQ